MPLVNGYEIGPSVDLTSAILSGADLRKAILPSAKLLNADLSGADLTRADLSKADLRGANLTLADLFGANLSGADLSGANLTLTDLFGANLSGAVWDSSTNWPDGYTPPTQASGQTDAGNMNPLKAIEAGFENYTNFSGRATRAQFFYWHLFTFLLVMIPAPEIIEALIGLLYLFTLIPTLSIAFRRMHDSGHSGLWIFCPIMNIVFCCWASEPFMNAYGPALVRHKSALHT